MTFEKITKLIIAGAGIAGVLFLFPFFLKLFAPFLAAFFTASLCQRTVRFLEKRFGISRGVSSAVLVSGMVVVVPGLAVAAMWQLLAQTKSLVLSLPDTLTSFRLQLHSVMQKIDGFKLQLPPELANFADNEIVKLQNYASNMSGRAASAALDAAGNIATELPSAMFFAVMFFLGTFFFTKDYVLVMNFLREIFPEKILKYMSTTKAVIVHAFSSYLRAQLYLMLLTAVVVSVCLWITGKDYALLWGIVCGLVDALPILGTAVILVPWALVSLVYGDMYSFVSLLIIQALVFVIRQLAEPRIISRQIGVHPLLTLVGVYAGMKFFGFPGVILAPGIVLLAVNVFVSYKENKGV